MEGERRKMRGGGGMGRRIMGRRRNSLEIVWRRMDRRGGRMGRRRNGYEEDGQEEWVGG